MAHAAPQDPPVSVKEKGDRVVVSFNVANAKLGSVKIEHDPSNVDGGSLLVKFSCVSPVRNFEKLLQLPHAIEPAKIVSDVQSKAVTVQLIKVDAAVTWGSTWQKAKPKGKAKRTGANGTTSPKSGRLDRMDSDDLPATPEGTALDPEVQPSPAFSAASEPSASETSPLPSPALRAQPAPGKPPEAESPSGPDAKTEAAAVAEPVDAEKSSKAKKKKKKKTSEGPGEECEEEEKVPAAPSKTKKKEGSAAAGKVSTPEAAPEPVGPKAGKSAKAKAKAGGAAAAPADAVPASVFEEAKALAALAAAKASAVADGGKKKQSTGSKADQQVREGTPIIPPTDPKVRELLEQGPKRFETDRKQGADLLRLAARKGYLPAYLKLAELAALAEDEPLCIDAMLSLLAEEKAPNQLLPELLSKCAVQLTALLRKPEYAGIVRTNAEKLAKIRKNWPIVAAVQAPPESPVGQSRSDAKVAPTKQAESAAAAAKPAGTGAWQDRGCEWRFGASLPKLASFAEARLECAAGKFVLFGPSRAELLSTNVPAGADADRARAKWSQRTKTLTITVPREVQAPNGQAAADHGSWQACDGEHKFTVHVPSVASLSESRLEIEAGRIQLYRADGTEAVSATLPAGTDSAKARAKWSQRTRQLTVTVPASGKATAEGVGRNGKTTCTLAGLAGEWTSEQGDVIGTVDGSRLVWSEGTSTSIKVLSTGEVAIGVGADEEKGRLDAAGRLVWSDGDVWLRRTRT